MNPEDKLSNTERQLYDMMSEISEDCWCAGWMGGNEYSLWAALHDGELKYGQSEINRDDLAAVAALSVQTGTWIVWRDDNSLPIAEHGPYAIPLHEWSAIYESKQARATPQAPTPAAAEGPEPAAPHILEALSYHANERDDLTLEDAVEAFRYGWKKVRGRSEREMLAQIIYLMASAPAEVAAPLPRQAAVSEAQHALSAKHEGVMRLAAKAIHNRGHEGDARLADSLLGVLAHLKSIAPQTEKDAK